MKTLRSVVLSLLVAGAVVAGTATVYVQGGLVTASRYQSLASGHGLELAGGTPGDIKYDGLATGSLPTCGAPNAGVTQFDISRPAFAACNGVSWVYLEDFKIDSFDTYVPPLSTVATQTIKEFTGRQIISQFNNIDTLTWTTNTAGVGANSLVISLVSCIGDTTCATPVTVGQVTIPCTDAAGTVTIATPLAWISSDVYQVTTILTGACAVAPSGQLSVTMK